MIWAIIHIDGRVMYRIVQDFYKGGRTQTAEVYWRLL